MSPTEFTIGDTSKFGAFKPGSGTIQQVKVPQKVSFVNKTIFFLSKVFNKIYFFNQKTLKESLADPSISIVDFGKMDSPSQIHIGMQALHAFYEKHNRYPGVWNQQDGAEFLEIAKEINNKSTNKVDIKDEFLVKLAYTSQGSIVGLTSFVGGVVAQEVLKALSGKYTPLNNWVKNLNFFFFFFFCKVCLYFFFLSFFLKKKSSILMQLK